ncbi:nonsense-mediated mRNA decay factor SMG5 [Centruroides vittatus]|uniref:nonsense-mediated mRNA decay factor SMG5 n=1 Tax=Centruroides vittatus TaxID=120091 RepID=UPI00350F2C84
MKKSFSSVNNDHKDGSRRLYRSAVEAARRLEDHMQNVSSLEDLLNSDITTIRIRLKDYCERLMFTDPAEYGRKAEELMWRKVYYDFIQSFKQQKKKTQGPDADYSLQIHLLSGIGNYHHLLLRLQTEFHLNLEGKIEIPFIWHQQGIKKDRWKKYQQSTELEENINEWVHHACHRFLVYLGDLARYMSDMGQNNSVHTAKRYYYQALCFDPTLGMPHNQLGTLAGMANCGLDATYHYMRCILCTHSFDGAEGNLQRVFDKNNQMYKEIITKDQNNESSFKVKRFLCTFLVLCEQFFLFHNDETSALCHDALLDLDKCLEYLYANEKGLVDSNHADGTNTVVFDDVIFKMTVMCIMCVARLQQKNKSAISASVAFTLALFSSIVSHGVKRIQESFFSEDAQNSLEECDLKNGEQNLVDTTPTTSPQPPLIHCSTISSGDNHDISKKYKEKLSRKNNKSVTCLRMLRRRRKMSGTSQEDSEFSEDSDDDKVSPSDHITSDISETGSVSSESLAELEATEDDLVVNGISTSSGDLSTLNGELTFSNSGDILSSSGELKPNHIIKNWKKKPNGKLNNNCKNELNNGIDSIIMHNKVNSSNKIKSSKQDLKQNISTITLLPLKTLNILSKEGLLPCLKIIFDWMQTHTEIVSACEESSKFLWCQVVDLLNFLLKIEENILSANELDISSLLQFSRNCSDWEQKYPLPEDIELQNLPLLENIHNKLNFDKKKSLSLTQQTFLRLQCLLNFGSVLCKCCNKVITFNSENKLYAIIPSTNGTINSNETETSIKKEVDNKELENQRKQMMRSMAHLWLKAEVNDLEVLVEGSSTPQLSPYLVPDTGSLCSQLTLLKQLVATKRFILVIPTVVIENLDQIKRESPSAREAIRWLESELRRGSRYMRAQKQQERLSLTLVKYPKKKDKEAWDFFKILECCHYLNQQGSNSNSDVPLVTLITGSSNMLPSNASTLALSVGVNMENMEEFVSKWRNSSKSQG